LSAELKTELPPATPVVVTLTPLGKGIFDVVVDGDLIYSKYQTGRFPRKQEITALIRSRL
jgi:selenoprotein W-related protein